MTLDEYKKQREAEKKVNQLILPNFKTQAAGESHYRNVWKNPEPIYSKADNDDAMESNSEETKCEENLEQEQSKNKKKLITIPLRFKPFEFETPRSPDYGKNRNLTDKGYNDCQRSRSGEPTVVAFRQASSQYPYRNGQCDVNNDSRQGLGHNSDHRRTSTNSNRGSRNTGQ
ncbi:unnamed protein product [Rotaria sordida]|uniref:Uncharacterized protein n=1 Tax=Rotaria sordida TaxID=392033 RepID=A0A813Z5Z5_9BILA|nr:unnamed protein product [Rotaria sordida]